MSTPPAPARRTSSRTQVNRLLALVPYLQAREEVSVEEAAREFGVSILAVPGGQMEGVSRALASLNRGAAGAQHACRPASDPGNFSSLNDQSARSNR